MNAPVDWLFIVVVFCCILGVLVSLILYFVNRKATFSPRVLAASIFCISVALLGFGLTISKEFIRVPHFWRVPVPFMLSIASLTFIYVRSVLEQQFRFQRRDWFLFIPAIAYTLQLMPFYLAPVSKKLQLIQASLADHSIAAREPESMLPEGWGIILRLVFNLTVLAFTYRLLFRWRTKVNRPERPIEQNREIYRWLVYLTLVLSSSFFVLIFEYIFQISRFFEVYRVMSVTVSGTVLFVTIYLLVKPNILYGLKGWLQEPEPVPITGLTEKVDGAVTESAQPMSPEQRKVTLSKEQGARFQEAIDKHFRENAPFVKQGYAIRDLSMELNIPSYQLSAFINQEIGKNFNEYVNDARVDYLLDQIGSSKEARQFTLEALGQSVGFKSRTAFIAAVKRKTGKTPSELFSRRGIV